MTKVSSEYEEIIFDYLEGNLSNNEREAFEMLLSSNEDLRSQVMDWKLTYVTASFQPTTDLTERILKSSKKTHWIFSLNSFICAIIFCSLIPVDIREHITQSFSGRFENPVLPATQPGKSPKQTAIIGTRRLNKKQVQHSIAEIDFPQHRTLLCEDIVFKKPNTYSLIRTTHLNLKETEFVMLPVKQSEQSHTKLLPRKKIRMLNRQKRLEYDRRLEKKFQSGNVPYVVPLNINNF